MTIGLSIINYLSDQVKIGLISQFINGISRVLQKLFKYFNGTIVSTSFVFPFLRAFPEIFTLYLNDSELAKLSIGSSL